VDIASSIRRWSGGRSGIDNSYGDVMRDKGVNQAVHRGAGHRHIHPTGEDGGRRGADVRLLARDVVRVGADRAVLEVIDAQRDGVVIPDGAQVRGDRCPPPVRFRDRGPELGPREVRVSLERRRARVGPVVHKFPRVIGAG
jgi:hypothetical protein